MNFKEDTTESFLGEGEKETAWCGREAWRRLRVSSEFRPRRYTRHAGLACSAHAARPSPSEINHAPVKISFSSNQVCPWLDRSVSEPSDHGAHIRHPNLLPAFPATSLVQCGLRLLPSHNCLRSAQGSCANPAIVVA
jgi:hypothetical protein